MKIVRIIARLNVGGPAKHVVWLSKLRSDDWETLLVAGTVPPGEDDMGYFATEQRVTPIFVPEMSREISLKDVLTIWKLYQFFRRERPDIVHTHTAKAGTVGRVAGFIYRWFTPKTLIGRPRACHFVHTYHGHIFHSYYGPLKTRIFLLIEKALARLITDRIVVLSEQQRREINEEFGVGKADQFVIIPLGIDLEVFAGWKERGQAFRSEFGLAADEILVGIVGRLTEVKNHELFLRAAALFKTQLSESGKSVRFLVIGDGGLRATLEQQAESLGLSADVIFTGSRRDLEEVYPALDIVALTSRNEGTPLTLIEAMANARPVISTAVGGVVDLLGAPVQQSDAPFEACQQGISVTPDDGPGFAAGLERLVKDAALRRETGARGLQFVANHYSKERLLKDIENLYSELLPETSLSSPLGAKCL
ncbi:MAG TPA: glycosyltransferase [Pyrinomonadaceae bacterium]|jgi:glycosyltransferase involved in cell wall biosynthesis|nr:glycosyltransferase [Pyrinomonadaceae bacterium]